MPTSQATTGRTYDGRKGGAELVEATAIALDFVGMRVKVPAILTEDRNSQSAGQGAGWLVRISENPRVSDSNGEAWRLLVISGVSGVFGVSDWWRLVKKFRTTIDWLPGNRHESEKPIWSRIACR